MELGASGSSGPQELPQGARKSSVASPPTETPNPSQQEREALTDGRTQACPRSGLALPQKIKTEPDQDLDQ